MTPAEELARDAQRLVTLSTSYAVAMSRVWPEGATRAFGDIVALYQRAQREAENPSRAANAISQGRRDISEANQAWDIVQAEVLSRYSIGPHRAQVEAASDYHRQARRPGPVPVVESGGPSWGAGVLLLAVIALVAKVTK